MKMTKILWQSLGLFIWITVIAYFWSRLILEQKSALYERLRSGNVTEDEKKQYKRLLVQFEDNVVDFGTEFDNEADKLEESEDNDDTFSEDENCIDPAEKWWEMIVHVKVVI